MKETPLNRLKQVNRAGLAWVEYKHNNRRRIYKNHFNQQQALETFTHVEKTPAKKSYQNPCLSKLKKHMYK